MRLTESANIVSISDGQQNVFGYAKFHANDPEYAAGAGYNRLVLEDRAVSIPRDGSVSLADTYYTMKFSIDKKLTLVRDMTVVVPDGTKLQNINATFEPIVDDDTGEFVVNIIYPIAAVRTVEIPLVVGWNLVSIPLELPDTSVPSVLASISGNYSRVMAYEEGYKTYDPALPEFSTLRNLTYRMGFWVKMKNASLLRATGAEPIDKSIPLITGWNLVGYLKDSNMSVPSALASIEGNYSRVMAYENGYKTYDPALPEFSTLQEMKPYLGYWIKATRPEVLEY